MVAATINTPNVLYNFITLFLNCCEAIVTYRCSDTHCKQARQHDSNIAYASAEVTSVPNVVPWGEKRSSGPAVDADMFTGWQPSLRAPGGRLAPRGRSYCAGEKMRQASEGCVSAHQIEAKPLGTS